MTTSVLDIAAAPTVSQDSARQRGQQGRALRLLRISGGLWLGTAVFGQALFAIYVAVFYGRAALQGRFQDWNKVLAHGYVPGQWLLNIVLGLHLIFVVLIIAGGALQLLPALRRRAPGFHRWNGRLYLLSAAILSLGGLALAWVRGTVGGAAQHISVSINALLILIFAGIAWRLARERRFDAHRRWALRLFLAVSGVWFFRIGLMLWLAIHQAPVGFDPKSFTGPFLSFLGFAQYLLPLAVLELYLRVQGRGRPGAQLAVAGGVLVLTLMTLGGVLAATMGMWLPRL
ncbi:MAG: DUF2306 domain-containing protein [Nevskiaceae bacterium]|jgi:hypothetical protein|nr:MAG: DUF2306 domain-containing protein [Nevskiaceae bacterium]TAM32840.1 MAG: DUF2306 domain-containing protein [Nevskiaceae bacterium]